MDNNSNVEQEIQFKNDNYFLANAEKRFDEIVDIEANLYTDLKNVYIYFAVVSARCTRYCAYIKDWSGVKKKLMKARNGLFNTSLYNDFKAKKNQANVALVLINIADDLVDLWREVMKDVTSHGISPKPRDVDIADSELETDPEKKELLEGEELIDDE